MPNDEVKEELQLRDHSEELLEIIKSDIEPAELRKVLSSYHDNDIAAVFPRLTASERKKLYRILSDEEISDIFSYLDDVEEYVSELDSEKAADIIESMDADDAVDVLNELDDSAKREIIGLMDDEAASDVKLIDSYSEGAVGSKMTTNYVSVTDGRTVKQAMHDVVDQAAENDNISTIYLVDGNEKYIGAFDLRDLIIARENTPLITFTQTSYPYVYASEQIDECIEKLKEYSEDSIPVLDADNKLIGVITSNDLVEAVGDVMNEDYAKLGGLTGEEELDEPTKLSVKRRIPWLIALVFLSFGVSTVIGLFENLIDQLAYLVFFQSLILDMSGNVGTQSLAVTIRYISDTVLDTKKSLKLFGKEAATGFVNGIIVGMLAFASSFVYLLFSQSVAVAAATGACIGVAMLVAMTLSACTGTLFPILLKRLGADPAVASGPLITTLNDLIAACTYYGLAMLLLLAL